VDTFESISLGLSVALSAENLFYVFIGVLIGTTIGVLPGLGSAGTVALLLPVTYVLPPASALIMLAGIYYGSAYGGTITSVLLRLPGEAATVVTTFDGYQMAKQGRAGIALGISGIGSFIGGTVAVIGLTFLAPLFAAFALRFGPPEYTLLATLGILLVSYLGTGTLVRSLIVAALGLVLATVGQDPVLGSNRFIGDVVGLLSGISFTAVAMGLFGIGEILYNLEHRHAPNMATAKLNRVLPTRADWQASRAPIARGSLIGFFLGILPGGGAVLSSLTSYTVEKRLAKDPSRFGRGAIEGVAGPETANNAASNSAFIPLLSLGIPANVTMAVIFGGLLLQGITPGPLLVEQNPDVFWGVIVSMYIGNIMLIILNVPMVKVFVQLLRVRMGILGPLTVVVTMLGVYSVSNAVFDMWVALAFGVLGYLMRKTGFEPAPLALAFILGPILETSFRQSLRLSDGSMDIFVTRPISGGLAAVLVFLMAAAAWRAFSGRKGPVVVADGQADSELADNGDEQQVTVVGNPRGRNADEAERPAP